MEASHSPRDGMGREERVLSVGLPRRMSSLEAKQEERKKRLAQLKAAAGGGQKRPNDGEGPEGKEQEKTLRFRSYKPESTELKEYIGEAPAVGPEATEKGLDTVEARVAQIEENLLQEEKEKNPELVCWTA